MYKKQEEVFFLSFFLDPLEDVNAVWQIDNLL